MGNQTIDQNQQQQVIEIKPRDRIFDPLAAFRTGKSGELL
jgi:hypothetical protein